MPLKTLRIITISITGRDEARLDDIRIWAHEAGITDLSKIGYNYLVTKKGIVQVGRPVQDGFIEIVLHGKRQFTGKQMRALNEFIQCLKDVYSFKGAKLKLFKMFRREDFMTPPFPDIEVEYSADPLMITEGTKRNRRVGKIARKK